MQFKHFSLIHFKAQIFQGIGGGATGGPPVILPIEESKTLGLGLELGIITKYLTVRPTP